MRLCGFVKVRNEILREGNLYRLLEHMDRLCDGGVICDDWSTDGTREHIQAFVAERPSWHLIEVPHGQQDFRLELHWKQQMLNKVHELKPEWILWMDGDELLEPRALTDFRPWLDHHASASDVWGFHYTQLWRSSYWARVDDQFDEGRFWKLWRYSPELRFEVEHGTHHCQFPKNLMPKLGHQAPFEVVHYGNWGTNLIWKCIQYYGGLGGVDRHLRFENAIYRRVDKEIRAMDIPHIGEPAVLPKAFEPAAIERILRLKNLRAVPGLFVVVCPTYDRAHTLPKALDSLLAQTYDHWICLVLDDGSTDNTPAVIREYQDRDPRILYCRYPGNRGGVAMNEIGMTLAVEMGEYWTRLGSDDWFEPGKLAADVEAFDNGAQAVYGPFQVVRKGQRAEVCNPPEDSSVLKEKLAGGAFAISWANCAVRTRVLHDVHRRYKSFCHSDLRNMEDFLVNTRISQFARWTFRGDMDRPDAVWAVARDGASSNNKQTAKDHKRTLELIAEENR